MPLALLTLTTGVMTKTMNRGHVMKSKCLITALKKSRAIPIGRNISSMPAGRHSIRNQSPITLNRQSSYPPRLHPATPLRAIPPSQITNRRLSATFFHLSMSFPNFKKSSPHPSMIDVSIPEDLEYFVTETAEDLEITPDELVQQAVRSYCKKQLGGRHE